jgi:hypothetical protein
MKKTSLSSWGKRMKATFRKGMQCYYIGPSKMLKTVELISKIRKVPKKHRNRPHSKQSSNPLHLNHKIKESSCSTMTSPACPPNLYWRILHFVKHHNSLKQDPSNLIINNTALPRPPQSKLLLATSNRAKQK